jgi:hypothetical protein
MALSGGAGWNSGKPAALSGRERVLERLPYRRRLSTVGGGGGSMVVSHWGGGGRRWTGQRGRWVLRGPQGFGWLTGGGLEVGTHGGLVTASIVAQWR